MSISIGANTQRHRTQNDFAQALGQDLQQQGPGQAADTLRTLGRSLRDGRGQLRTGHLRIINTTNAKELAFAYKRFGWGPQHRTDRTAQALEVLLRQAGVANAKTLVDSYLRPDGAAGYQRLSAERLDRLLNEAAVQQALQGEAPAAPAAPVAPAAPQGQAQANAQERESAAPAQPAPLAPADAAGAGVAQAPRVMGDDPRLLSAFAVRKPALEQALFASPERVKLEQDPGFFPKIQLKSGQIGAFRDLSGQQLPMVKIKPGCFDAPRLEQLYGAFRKDHLRDDQALRPPDWLVVRDPLGTDASENAFELIEREALMSDPRFQDAYVEVWATVTVDPNEAVRAAPPAPPQARAAPLAPAGGGSTILVESQAGSQDSSSISQSDDSALQAAVQRPQQPTAAEVRQALQQMGHTFQNQALGQGAFGATFLAQHQGQDEVVKLFMDRHGNLESQEMTGTRSVSQVSELYAAYLVRAKDAAWVKPQVIHPSHYIIQSPPGSATPFEAVPVDQIKQRARQAAASGGSLQCLGLIMARAPGQNLQELLDKKAGLPGGQKDAMRLARSGLQSLRSLNERGMIHRDIKPANLNFDPQSGQAHFFDTGMLFKSRKVAADREGAKVNAVRAQNERRNALPDRFAGTPGYMHPKIAAGGRVGSQQDLHAFALTTLHAAYPQLNIDVLAPDRKQVSVSLTQLLQRLDSLSQSAADPRVRADAQRFLQDSQDVNGAAHLIKTCLELANDIQPATWANRKFSDNKLQELLQHKALQGLD